MTPKISQYLGKPILVCIPALFGDEKCRSCTLLGAEATGLWLQSDELATKLLPEERRQYASAGPVVFVPFAQIAGVLVLTGTPSSQPVSAADSPPAARTTKATTKTAATATKKKDG